MKNAEIAKEIEDLKKRVKELENKPSPTIWPVVIPQPYPVYPQPDPWPYRVPYWVSYDSNTTAVTK